MPLRRDSETQPLLHPLAPPPQTCARSLWFPLKRFRCIPSKGAVLVLFWTLIVGAIYKTVTAGSTIAVRTYLNYSHSDVYTNIIEVATISGIHLIFALASIFYPLAGFIADVCVGRYKMVIISLLLLLCGFVISSIGSALYFSKNIEAHHETVIKGVKQFAAVVIIGFLLTFVGLSGYQSNYIQLGLDQLQDAPSHSLGLFVHLVEWFMIIGLTVLQFVISWCTCNYNQHIVDFLISLPFLYVFLLLIVVLIGLWKHNWFHTEPARHNPYRTVFQVLKFAWNHKCDAFTYGEDKEPSRLDFAKEMYGGPFTVEQVEDVKMFLKVLIVLLTLGPVFVLVVPSGIFYANFVQHVTSYHRDNISCRWEWIALDNGVLKYSVATFFFPFYMWFLYSVLRNCIPRIFTRLWIWILVLVVCVVSLVLIDLFGHILYHHREHHGMVCMFSRMVGANEAPTLQMHWIVITLPTVPLLISPTMITTTTFEFITAQSPHSMKGLLVGVFFAIVGLFQLIGSLTLLPFSLPNIWKSSGKTAPIVNCGFGYLLFTCSVGITGFLLFSVAVKRYRYRERE